MGGGKIGADRHLSQDDRFLRRGAIRLGQAEDHVSGRSRIRHDIHQRNVVQWVWRIAAVALAAVDVGGQRLPFDVSAIYSPS